MKIALIIPSLANKGPIIMVRDLVAYLIREGHSCEVFFFDKILELDFPCATKRIGYLEKINFSNYEIIHSHLFRPDLYCALHRKDILRSGAKVISTIHTAIYDDLYYTYGKFVGNLIIPVWKYAWKSKDHIIVLTETAKAYYEINNFTNVSVINNGRDLPDEPEPVCPDDLQLINLLKQNYTLIGTICAIDKRKGLEQILNLLLINKQYAFIIVGDGPERNQLEAIARRYRISDRFKILGYRNKGYRYLVHFDSFVIPSRSEGHPLALLEAMALKTPIICSEIPVFLQQFEDQGLTFFSLDDISSLQLAVDAALTNSSLMTERAYFCYKSSYTVVKMGINYNKLYHSLMIDH